MKTDDDHATMRESFSLVQNILFIGYTNALPANCLFFIVDSGGNSWCPYRIIAVGTILAYLCLSDTAS